MSASVPQSPQSKWRTWLRRSLPFVLVSSAHAVALTWLATTLVRSPVLQTTPRAVIGVLVPSEPKPLPMVVEPQRPKLQQKPAVRPQPMPPPKAAPPSERAVTVPLPQPPQTATVHTVAAADAPPAAPAQGAPAKELPQPVTPPRSDAAQLNNPAPVYPPLSRRFREEGRVLFDVYIMPDGSVGQIKLKRSSGYPRLDDAALDAVRRWRYIPAKRGDEPIPYWYVQPLNFELDASAS